MIVGNISIIIIIIIIIGQTARQAVKGWWVSEYRSLGGTLALQIINSVPSQ